jgi:hypothetical protein
VCASQLIQISLSLANQLTSSYSLQFASPVGCRVSLPLSLLHTVDTAGCLDWFSFPLLVSIVFLFHYIFIYVSHLCTRFSYLSVHLLFVAINVVYVTPIPSYCSHRVIKQLNLNLKLNSLVFCSRMDL